MEGKRRYRYAFINMWRNIDMNSPIQRFPLACLDSSSLSDEELRLLQVHYTDRIGENYLVAASSTLSNNHHWLYFPAMKNDEVLLIKQWDSYGMEKNVNENRKIATFAAHSAFLDPTTSEKAPPRQS